jgi:hypothetical protein
MASRLRRSAGDFAEQFAGTAAAAASLGAFRRRHIHLHCVPPETDDRQINVDGTVKFQS